MWGLKLGVEWMGISDNKGQGGGLLTPKRGSNRFIQDRKKGEGWGRRSDEGEMCNKSGGGKGECRGLTKRKRKPLREGGGRCNRYVDSRKKSLRN